MKKNLRIFIDPTSRILYSSFYIEGLYEVFGKKNVLFSGKYFKDLKRRADNSFDHYMAFVIMKSDKESDLTKIVIDFRDKPSVNENAYNWADRYAKINLNTELTHSKFQDKIVSIPPGFGIKIWNIWETAYNCLRNLAKCQFNSIVPIVPIRYYLSDYYAQFKRPQLRDYESKNPQAGGSNSPDSENSYVFMIGTLWKHKNCIENTNLFRKFFLEQCRKNSTNVEGGFFATKDHPQFDEFKHLIFFRRYSPKEYIRKTKLSAFVFNTPAVHGCHGWKLGEYLAMGKAIISTPLTNQLPEEIVDGEMIHFVSNLDQLKSAINLLFSGSEYRKSLEVGAREYYLKYATPEAVIKGIVTSDLLTNTL